MEEYLSFAKKLAVEAGKINRKYFQVGVKNETKSDNSPLTIADTAINQMVIDRIESQYPDHSVLGEEKSVDKGGKTVWVVDPIDGTMPFVRGVPTNVFSIALVEDGEPIVAVVYDPHMKRTFSAIKDQGAYLNNERMHTNNRDTLERGYIVVEGNRYFKNRDYVEKFCQRGVKIFSYGSVIYAHMLVASGQLEAAIFPIKNPWDSASAKLIVEEAGGTTTNLLGESQRYDQDTKGFISSCSEQVHREVLGILSDSIPVY